MAISLIGALTTANNVGASLTVAHPAGLAADDVMVAMIGKDDDVASASDDGWTTWVTDGTTTGNDIRSWFGFKVVTAADVARGDSTWSGDAEDWSGVIIALRGVDLGQVADVAFTRASGPGNDPIISDATPTSPPITPVTAGAWIICGVTSNPGETTGHVGPANMDDYASDLTGEGNGDNATGLAWYDGWAAGAFTPNSWTNADSTSESHAYTAAIRPSTGTAHTDSATDPVGVTDSTSRIRPAIRAATDPVGVTDDTTPARTLVRAVTDPVGVTDSTDPAKGIPRPATDPVGVTDSTTPVKAIGQTVPDPVGVADVVSTVHDQVRISTDPVGVTDLTSPAKAIPRAVTDPVGVTDLIVPAITKSEVITDTVGVTDSISPVKAIAQAVTDPVGVTDSPVKALGIAVTDPVGVIDDTADVKSGGQTRTVTDPVGVTDLVGRVIDAAWAVTDDVGVTDGTLAARIIIRLITDAVGITDSTVDVLAAGALAEIVTDPVGVTDSITATLDVAPEHPAASVLVGVVGLPKPAGPPNFGMRYPRHPRQSRGPRTPK